MSPSTSSRDVPEPTTTIAAYSSSPDRTVFTEGGNPDGWISTDVTVPLDS
jgi:hypothetical protein